MAVGLSFPIPVSAFPTSPKTTQSNLSAQIKPTPICTQFIKSTTITIRRRKSLFFIKAIDNNELESESESESETASAQQSASTDPPQPDSLSELGSEIKKAMKEREQRRGKDGDFWSGVTEEVREIEWPAFGKVLGITGVVLGVIAGSSVVLLTLNAVLAEFSDRVFAGRGVQDFF
ncbi:preprotein translocase subunit SECE1-like [Cornus florida]|uniref:preprotein translocase subunit SECE1-like n=1 Tax=Cornus florida TaxID=4283 RepID=UPI0028A00B5F|nr:preprotein translocase subunit SECE1-like [Cornus florida]